MEIYMSQSTTDQKILVRDAFETVFNDKDLDAMDRYYAEDCVSYGGPGGDLSGLDEHRAWFEQLLAAFPDFEATEQFSLAEDDLVCSRLTYTGTHEGEFLGIPATGTEVEVEGVSINRVKDGKIVETYPHADLFDLLIQVGAIDAPDR